MQKTNNLSSYILFIAALTGVGYSSGQEIRQFFVHYGTVGLWTALLAPGVLCGLSFLYIQTARKKDTASYKSILVPEGAPAMRPFVDGVVTLILVIGVVLPIAAAGSLLRQLTGLPSWCGNLALAALLAVAMCIRNITVITKVMTPLLYVFLGCLCFICIYTVAVSDPVVQVNTSPDCTVASPSAFSGFAAMVQYMSYNLLVLFGVLTPVSREFSSARGALLCCVVCSGVVGGTVLLQYLALMKLGTAAASVEMPLVYAASVISPVLRLFFRIIMLFGAFGTAVSCYNSLLARAVQNDRLRQIRYRLLTILLLAAAFFLSLWGFSNIIEYAYPLIGTLGLLIHGVLIVSFLRTFKQKQNTPQKEMQAGEGQATGKTACVTQTAGGMDANEDTVDCITIE